MATCSCSSLLSSAKCICLRGKQLLVLQTQLFIKWAAAEGVSPSSTVAGILAASKCYLCLEPDQMQSQIVRNLVHALNGTTPAANCYDCLPLDQLRVAKANVLCSISANATTDPVTPAALTAVSCFTALPRDQIEIAITQLLFNIVNALTSYTQAQAMDDAKCLQCLSSRQLMAMQIVLAAAVTSSVPASISGLVLWLDASTLGLAAAAPVTSWPDRSGNSNNFSDVAAAAPAFNTTFFSAGSVLFTGGKYLQCANTLSAQPFSVLMVCRVQNTGGADNIYMGNATTAINHSPAMPGGVQAFGCYTGADSSTNGAVTIVGVNKSLGIVAPGTGINIMFYVNGALQTNSANNNLGIGWNATKPNLAAFPTVAPSLFGSIAIAEMVMYNRVISATDVGTLQTYWAAKWGI